MSSSKSVFAIHHETNASSQPTINNNISINASNEVKIEEPDFQPVESNKPSNKEQQPIEPSLIERENEFLKKILELYMNQQVYWSGKFIVLKPDELLDLIKILLPNTQLKLFTNEQEEITCCGVRKEVPYVKVDSIWFDDDKHNQLNLKYEHSEIVALLEQYRISIKYIRTQ